MTYMGPKESLIYMEIISPLVLSPAQQRLNLTLNDGVAQMGHLKKWGITWVSGIP